MALDVTEGWTGDLDFVLQVDGTPYAWQGGDTVALILKTANGHVVKTQGNVAIVAAAAGPPVVSEGTVRYSPDAGDLRAEAGPYQARFQVTTGGRVVFFPNGQPDVWRVYAP